VRRLATIVFALSASFAFASDPSHELITRTALHQERVSALRGLPFLADVEVAVEPPHVMREKMEEDLREEVSEADLAGLVFAWAQLGLAPPDLPLFDILLAVLEEAVGGYYSPKERRLVIVDRRDEPSLDGARSGHEDMVIAHELVHALQDQHFDLDAMTQRELGDGDVDTALKSLFEGDASYAMLFAMVPNPDAIPLRRMMSVLGGLGIPTTTDGTDQLSTAPRALTGPLTFPYVQGLMFAQDLKLSGTDWSAVDAAYAAPPLSTEQILHPEKYIGPNVDWPTLIRFEDAQDWMGPRWDLAEMDTLGEAGVSLLFQEHFPTLPSVNFGRGWDGDRLAVWRRGDRGVVMWLTIWDSPIDADDFTDMAFDLVRKLRPNAVWEREDGLIQGRERGLRHRIDREDLRIGVYLSVPKRQLQRLRRHAATATYREVRTLDEIAPYEPDGQP
jgi:hypothetical protein